jgi:hypothetical protein
MASRQTYSALALTLITASVTMGACSSSSTKTTPPTDAGGSDTMAAEDAAYVTGGLVGCSPLEDGCFKQAGPYTAPTVATTCPTPGNGTTTGAADNHCNGMPAQTVTASSCSVSDAGPQGDSGPAPTAGVCGENGPDYGATEYGNEGDDDDCKYHVTWQASPICENDGTYFTVTANYLAGSMAPLTGACTFAEVCLNNSHPGPNVDSRPPAGSQTVVEGPPGTYTVGPVQFDQAGDWTVRFHFNEICCDVASSSPHGHAAFHVTVP